MPTRVGDAVIGPAAPCATSPARPSIPAHVPNVTVAGAATAVDQVTPSVEVWIKYPVANASSQVSVTPASCTVAPRSTASQLSARPRSATATAQRVVALPSTAFEAG